MADDGDDELLERARVGDRDALATLLARHEAQIYRFGMKMCRDPEDAKDVLQETLLAMARGVGDFRGASSLTTWLYTIARRFCMKKRRKRQFEECDANAQPTLLPNPAPAPDDALAEHEAKAAIERAIATLEPMYREVLVLRDVEGLTAAEVAEVLGMTIPAVKSRLHRARLSLRTLLAPVRAPPATRDAGTCPDVLGLFSRHLEDEISADDCAQMQRHLQSCDRCRRACDALERTLARCKAARATHVPAAVQESVRVALHDFLALPG